MLHTRLKEHTREKHLELERTFMRRLQKLKSEAEYAEFLLRLWDFHSLAEKKISIHINRRLVPDLERRIRSEFLMADVAELIPDFGLSSQCDSVPDIDSHARAIGSLYVLEGSTLGGKIVAEMITRRLGITRGLRFFNGYGKDTGPMWRTFTEYLNHDFSNEEGEEILDSAGNTFAGFNQWLQENE